MTDTNELRKLLAAATPLPWIVQKDNYFDEASVYFGSWSVTGPANDPVPGWGRTRPKAFDDGSVHGEFNPSCKEPTRDLIVAAVNGLPAMLDELDDARAEVERLRDNGDVRMFVFRANRAREVSRWAMRCGALLEKHKETNQ